MLGMDAGGYNSTLSNWNAAGMPFHGTYRDFGINPDYKEVQTGASSGCRNRLPSCSGRQAVKSG